MIRKPNTFDYALLLGLVVIWASAFLAIKVVVPDYRINNNTDFNFDGVAAFMKVNTSDENLPMLGVYDVFSIASGDLTLPYKVE